MGRAGLVLLLLAALGAGARGHEGSGEPGGSPAPGPPLQERCLLPKLVGRCRASFPRWWYNATSRTCQRFTYGGCGANLNNFLVEDECRVTCAAAADGEDLNEIPQASQRTEQSADEEPARRVQPANTFPYAGDSLTLLPRPAWPELPPACVTPPSRAGGSTRRRKPAASSPTGAAEATGTNYLSEAESLARCSESCAAPRLTGPCRAAFPRWYFDPAAQACKQFIYGGCKGNKNNYLREELCLRQCSGAAGGAEGPEPGVHSSRVVALAVLLAILVAVLLGSVVVFFVWLCKRNQELSLSVPWSPLDDKEYLMSNAYTL